MFRIRARYEGLKGAMVILADNVPTLEKAYEIVAKEGKGTSRVFYIDEVKPELFSKITARVAQNRLNEIRLIKEKEYEREREDNAGND